VVANFPTSSQPGFFLQKPEYGNQRALPSCRLDRPTRPSFISIRVVRNAKPTPVEFTVPRDDAASLLRDRRKKRRTRFNENVVRRAEVGYTLHQCAQQKVPSAHVPRPQPKRHLDRFSRFCAADVRVSSGVGACHPPQNRPSHWWIWTYLIRGYLGPLDSASHTASRSVQPFLHNSKVSADSPYTLQ